MRLIDAEKLEKDIRDYADKKIMNPGYIEYANGICSTIGVINNQPTVNQWIPVADHNPDVNKPVFVTFRNWNDYDKKHRYGTCKAIWIPVHTITDEEKGWAEEDFEDVTGYDESEDKYYIKEGWWEVIENWSDYTEVYISGEVVAWQPLPEPYKEVK